MEQPHANALQLGQFRQNVRRDEVEAAPLRREFESFLEPGHGVSQSQRKARRLPRETGVAAV